MEKHHVAILSLSFLWNETSLTPPNTGLMNRLCLSTLNTSFCLISDEFETKSDNIIWQMTNSVHNLLESNSIHICLLPPNTTDHLQPMDVSVNKPAKDFLKRKFDEWYSEQVIEQLDGENMDDFENVNLQPIDITLPALKMAENISNNPQMIVNGFTRSGIAGVLEQRMKKAVEQRMK